MDMPKEVIMDAPKEFKVTIKCLSKQCAIDHYVKVITNYGIYTIKNDEVICIVLPQGHHTITYVCVSAFDGSNLGKEDVKTICVDKDLAIVLKSDVDPTTLIRIANLDCLPTTRKTGKKFTVKFRYHHFNIFSSIWNNNFVMTVLSLILSISACIYLFPSDRLMFIVFMVISEFLALGLLLAIDLDIGKAFFFATIIALTFSTLLSLIVGIDLYPDTNCKSCGGKGYFGGGKYGQMVDCPDC